jgi:hypothetical protein
MTRPPKISKFSPFAIHDAGSKSQNHVIEPVSRRGRGPDKPAAGWCRRWWQGMLHSLDTAARLEGQHLILSVHRGFDLRYVVPVPNRQHSIFCLIFNDAAVGTHIQRWATSCAGITSVSIKAALPP